MDAIIQKYVNVCRNYGHHLIVHTVNGNSLKSQLVDNVITINTANMTTDDFIMYLSYRVREFLLPRLAFETERLKVRRYRETDKNAVIFALSNPETTLMFGGWEVAELPQKAEEITKVMKSGGTYVIELKESGQVIGFINIGDDEDRAVEAMGISYVVAKEYQRQGYAYEAVSRMVNILVNELDLELLLAVVFTFNKPSIGLLTKIGFIQEGVKRKALYHSLCGASDCISFYIEKQGCQ